MLLLLAGSPADDDVAAHSSSAGLAQLYHPCLVPTCESKRNVTLSGSRPHVHALRQRPSPLLLFALCRPELSAAAAGRAECKGLSR